MIVDFEEQVCAAFAAATTTAIAGLTPLPQVALFGDDTDLVTARIEFNAEVTGIGAEPTDVMVYRYMRNCVLYAAVITPKMTTSNIGAIVQRVRNVIELSAAPTGSVNVALLQKQLSVAGVPLQTGMQRMAMDAGDFPLFQVIMAYEFPLFYNYQPPEENP